VGIERERVRISGERLAAVVIKVPPRKLAGAKDLRRDHFDRVVREEIVAEVEEAEDGDECCGRREQHHQHDAPNGHFVNDYRVRSATGEPRWQSFTSKQRRATISCSAHSQKSTPRSPTRSSSRSSARTTRSS